MHHNGQSTLATAAEALWEHSSHVAVYAARDLRPVEVLLLARYHDAFSRRVLEIGCGGGRVAGYITELAEQAVGIDIAPEMVAYCQRRYPKGDFALGDLRALEGFADGSFDMVFPSFGVIDILDHQERAVALDEMHRMIAPGGLLVLSTHNRGFRVSGPGVRTSDPVRFAVDVLRLPARLRHRRALLPAEREEAEYAIRNDSGHDFRALHYYVTRDDGAHQLQEHGFEIVECLGLDGEPVTPGTSSTDTQELHFVARRG